MSVVILAVVVPACTTYDDAPRAFEGDAGPLCDEDGGCAPAAFEGIDEPVAASDAFAACSALVAKTCGAESGPRCDAAPGCAAAGLLAAHEPDGCAAALANEVSYPPCAASSCQALVERVCGVSTDDGYLCADAPGCDPALRLRDRSIDPAAAQADRDEAVSSCDAALGDDDIFGPCA